MNIAVIPARGGSKRIPRKNIRDFCGKPMIAWAIDKAKQSGLFEHVVVSTDDAEIAEIAGRCGAQTPFVRPADLADDRTPTVPVIAHAVRSVVESGWGPRYVCCVYPCAPFLDPADLAAALEISQARDADFVFPVAHYPHPVQRAMRRLSSGKMQFLHPEHEMTQTQELEPAFHDAGQFYWGKTSAWLAQMRMHSDGLGMPIPSWRVVDIDTEEDWVRAERSFRALCL
jgi:pseudaminic acid cytidylyltransferase